MNEYGLQRRIDLIIGRIEDSETLKKAKWDLTGYYYCCDFPKKLRNKYVKHGRKRVKEIHKQLSNVKNGLFETQETYGICCQYGSHRRGVIPCKIIVLSKSYLRCDHCLRTVCNKHSINMMKRRFCNFEECFTSDNVV